MGSVLLPFSDDRTEMEELGTEETEEGESGEEKELGEGKRKRGEETGKDNVIVIGKNKSRRRVRPFVRNVRVRHAAVKKWWRIV